MGTIFRIGHVWNGGVVLAAHHGSVHKGIEITGVIGLEQRRGMSPYQFLHDARLRGVIIFVVIFLMLVVHIFVQVGILVDTAGRGVDRGHGRGGRYQAPFGYPVVSTSVSSTIPFTRPHFTVCLTLPGVEMARVQQRQKQGLAPLRIGNGCRGGILVQEGVEHVPCRGDHQRVSVSIRQVAHAGGGRSASQQRWHGIGTRRTGIPSIHRQGKG
mmetsp:Transcript_13020/g.15882  ORF Transcript_13020/g.15882 Transcript_13020/m.15882 type:complete len:213 (+) Transcript_13020:637-1275(+)